MVKLPGLIAVSKAFEGPFTGLGKFNPVSATPLGTTPGALRNYKVPKQESYWSPGAASSFPSN
ncbi:hypothetical protein M407DRAFT_23779 [Tulasnella calospora MUT 4182]|uniref:Uncharacterized protein n=1 Tax=Tulasnella calospora MUT 4182 TaxID=1051891 RepID=A0A0C3QKL0_9AGAM|nr:hypothetical protein M407DRAFT_23779 [Tulasnella calospora MUT 4182]